MRPHRLALALVFTSLLAGSAVADRLDSERRFGLGLELGAPTGLNAKYFMGGMVAIQGGLGVMRDNWYYRYHDGLHLHAEVVWHPVVLHSGRDVTIPLHIGIGGRMLDLEGRCWNGNNWVVCDNDTHIGVRAPFGVSFLFNKVPMDVFLELALVVDVLHLDDDEYMDDYDRAGIDGVLGARYYF
jgi:hypothetical protein